MNPHLSIFRPYESLVPWHEDQLTRAAMVVLSLVPMACEALMRRLDVRSLAQLPPARFDTQFGLAGLGIDDEDGVRREDVVSVFLTPDLERTPSGARPIDAGRQRLDGVIRFEDHLVVVIESKLNEGADDRQWIGVSDRPVAVAWHDLLEDWLALIESRLLAPAEHRVIVDFFDFAEEHFSWLLPFHKLRRAVGDEARVWRWLVATLGAATGLPVVEGEHVNVRVDEQLGAVCLQRIALHQYDDQLEVAAWPGEQKPQAEHLYQQGRAARLLERLDRSSWHIRPNLHLSFRNAAPARRLYLPVEMPVDEYIQRFEGADWDLVGQHEPGELHGSTWSRLVRDFAVASDDDRRDRFSARLGQNRPFFVRPGLEIQFRWSLEDAMARDDDERLVPEVREAIVALLDALGEEAMPIPSEP